MSEWQQYKNPWAEKLSQVSLPDGGESWKAMEALLDREMPGGRRWDKRRWFLLVLLLLLLIGVCNCPGRRWLFSGKSTTGGMLQPVPVDGKGRGGPLPGATLTPQKAANVGDSGNRAENVRDSGNRAANGTAIVVKKSRQKTAVKKGGQHPGGSNKEDPNVGMTKRGDTNNDGARKDSARKDSARKDGANKPNKGVAKKGDADKGGEKKGGEKKKDSSKTARHDGWMVGIGLNQFFTVGGQQASSYNSGGITGTLGDYIPVPMVRYYVNPKLYVQLEAQINTPQYTKKNLVAVSTPPDSLSPAQTVTHTVSINKLFYFNVPFSVHYNVGDHLDLGAGLQYSRLTNGIGVYNNNYNNNGTDSLATETKSFKGDPAYKEIRTHEFRFLVDANYNWKHFIVGIRYNQALSKFIHVEISPSQITQARNSSLQLYLRYIIWDGRKKKSLLPAK